MRIISGSAKGRRLLTPKDTSTTRPLPDRVRTAAFNMLVGHIEGAGVLDVFAGTGSFGLEALSRGAGWCHFVERDKKIVGLLRRNLAELGLEDRATVHHGDALGAAALAAAPRPAHLVMFDPPYTLMREPRQRGRVMAQLERATEMLDAEGFALLRTPWPMVDLIGEEGHQRRIEVNLDLEGARGPETHAYGSTALHWFMRGAAEAEPDQGEVCGSRI